MPDNAPTFTPSQVATELGTSTNTIRRYATMFGGHLSAGATPDPGGHRVFTAEDVAIMRAARGHLATGATYEQVNQLLATVQLEPMPSTQAGEAVATVPGGDAVAELVPLLRSLVATDAQLQGLTQTVQQMATDRATDAHRVQQLASQVAQLGEDRARPLFYLLWFAGGFALALVVVFLLR